MPKPIGARTRLRFSDNVAKRNLGPEVKEKIEAKKLAKATKANVAKNAKTKNAEELHRIAQEKRANNLERSPKKDMLELNTSEEEKGFFKIGNDVFEIKYPR